MCGSGFTNTEDLDLWFEIHELGGSRLVVHGFMNLEDLDLWFNIQEHGGSRLMAQSPRPPHIFMLGTEDTDSD